MGRAPRHQKEELAACLRRIFRLEHEEAEARQAFRELADQMDGKAEDAIRTFEDDLEDAIAVLVLPAVGFAPRICSNGSSKRCNGSGQVIRIFPTGPPPIGSSGRSWPSSTKSGSLDAATST